jgi:hypothetical protein
MGEYFGPFPVAQRDEIVNYMNSYYGKDEWIAHDLGMPPPCFIQNKTTLEVRGPMAWHEAIKYTVPGSNYHFVEVTSKCHN